MSIVAYTGLPGSGKSYGVVENVILPALEDGRTVVTNIPLKVGYLSEDYPSGRIVSFDSDVNECFWDLDHQPAGAIFVIDEAWRYWPSGLKANNIPERVRQFFTEHRHMVGDDGRTNEIILVTQDLQQVCAFVRNLVEETYRARKLTAVGQKKKYRVDIYAGAAVGQNPSGQPLRQLFGRYKPEVYRYYQSHTHNKTDYAAGMEEKPDQRANLLKSPFFLVGVPLALVLMVVCVWYLKNFFFGGQSLGDPEPAPVSSPTFQANASSSALSQARSRPVSPSSPDPFEQWQLERELDGGRLPLSESWRIVGRINQTLILYSEERGERYIQESECGGFVNTRETFCVINGRLVTWYSARPPRQPEDEVDGSPEFNFGGGDGA